jgi:hypothetical protein
MPIEATAGNSIAVRTRDRRIARLAFGTTLTFLIAMAFDWTLAYLAPCFVIPLLQAPKAPSLTLAARIFFVTLLIMLVCYLGADFARQFPVVFLVALIPGLFWTFRYNLRGGSKLVVLLILIGFMLLPMAAKLSAQLTWQMASSFVGNIALSLAVTAIMFTLFPALPSEPVPEPKPLLPDHEVDRQAWIMTFITGSITWAYFSFDWTNVHTPMYVAIFIQQLSLARGRMVTKAILGANAAAGLVTMAMYSLLVMAPNFLFMATLSLTVILIFSRMIMSGVRWAPLAGAALSSTMILLGSAITSFDDGGGDMFADRLGELGAAAIYTVVVLYVLEAFFPQRQLPVNLRVPN